MNSLLNSFIKNFALDINFNEWYAEKIDERSEIGIDDGGPEHLCITDDKIFVMQYTGLTVSFNSEICEGDIVQIEDNEGQKCPPYIIEWSENVFNFIGRCVDGLDWMMLEEFEGCVLLGNIYENPELL